MHELSIARAVIDQVSRAAEEQDVGAVSRVTLAVGRLSGVVPAALELNFDLAAAGTVLDGAELVIEPRPIVARCPVGDHDLTMDDLDLWCDEHACATPEIRSGEELEILSFEIADDHPDTTDRDQVTETEALDDVAAHR